MAKQAEADRKISFSQALQAAFNRKYESLPDKLIPRIGLAVDGNVNESRKQLKKALEKQKGKDSIDYRSAMALCRSYLNHKTYSGIKPQVMQLLASKDQEKFIIEKKILKQKWKYPDHHHCQKKKRISLLFPLFLPIISMQDSSMIFLEKELQSIIMWER